MKKILIAIFLLVGITTQAQKFKTLKVTELTQAITTDSLVIADDTGLLKYISLDNLKTGLGNTNTFKLIPSDFDFTNIPIDYDNAVWVISNEHNLGANTITLPENVTLNFQGGKLSNGILECDNTFIEGFKGLNKDIELNGTIRGDVINFDWFDNEQSTKTELETFINGNNATFGTVPTISDKNSTILQMLRDNNFSVYFGKGIYPFDIQINGGIKEIEGYNRRETLLWFPQSIGFYMNSGSTYGSVKNITIESYGSVFQIENNAIFHGFLVQDSFLVSYSDHAINQISGLIYGSKFENVAVYGGEDKGGFYNMSSGSNVFHNVVDMHIYFSRTGVTNDKGVLKALFYNTSAREFSNSNISYAGLKYVIFIDIPGLYYFTAHNCVFEANTHSFQAICKTDTSNFYINFYDNRYIGDVLQENGYAFILENGNTYVINMDNDILMYGNNIKNQSALPIRNVSTLVDVGGTKYRLEYKMPKSSGGQQELFGANQDLADEYGFSDLYALDGANISNINVQHSTNANTMRLPSLSDINGIKEGFYRDVDMLKILGYRENSINYSLLSSRNDKTHVIFSYEDYTYWHFKNHVGYTYLVMGDIDLDGANMPSRNDLTFVFLGGSINNGTIPDNASNKYINFKGTALLSAKTRNYGTTANRPTTNLFKGDKYFDTDLNYPVWWDGMDWVETNAKYKIYTALLTQTGTSAPTATILENTIGVSVVWSYNSVGTYIGTLSGAFTDNKTICFITQPTNGNNSTFGLVRNSSDNEVVLDSWLNGSKADGQIGITNTFGVEIRVYN